MNVVRNQNPCTRHGLHPAIYCPSRAKNVLPKPVRNGLKRLGNGEFSGSSERLQTARLSAAAEPLARGLRK